MNDQEWGKFKEAFVSNVADTKIFMNGVEEYFATHPNLRRENKSVIHSTKKRIKDIDHLRDKIERKNAVGRDITPENLFHKVTDIAGVRILLLFQGHFSVVDNAIRRKIENGDWVFNESPKAFTWDPEASRFFSSFDVEVQTRDTFYTSVHYLIKPRKESHVCCEIQVRTLFEEIWGEIDHMINYPHKTDNASCKEQLMVLSKIVGAGSRLVDSIQRSIEENNL
ncbi:hypothetical protein P7L79_00010 (plasmid) [Tistrella mobilis]|uniref:(p)ppGpp synthetase n=1 Tax=Tistrella mobilis TaxID=171437 RepID=UPI0035565126